MESALLSSPRILLVESYPALEVLLSEVLSDVGYNLVVVETLEAVPDQLERDTFALVLADVYAGRIRAGSFTPAHRLRRLASPTPVGLLMTVPFSPEEARRAGFAFVLPMPFELEDLLAEVASALQLPLRLEDQQRVQVVQRFFAARQAEDWSALQGLCTEDIMFYPLAGSGASGVRRMQGLPAMRAYFATAAAAGSTQTFLHVYYTALPKGLIARYVRLWTTPEGERRRETKIALFHFQGARITQVGIRSRLRPLQDQAQGG